MSGRGVFEGEAYHGSVSSLMCDGGGLQGGGEGEIEGGGGEARWRLGDSGSWVSVLGDSASCVSRSCTRACMLGCSGPGMCMTKLRHVGI